jgi:putative ABC transport system ATP-binding protein
VPLISVRNLTKLYRMGDSIVRALDGVDLDVERGEFVAIIGPSGSGKSTMMHLLGCLDRPTQGRYVFDGQDVGRLSDRELAAIRNRSIGFVFQTFNLINRTTALDNVAVPLFYARKANARAPSRVALERVGLEHRGHHRPGELSGGERQRVAIARAIVNNPLLLLADEPTGNLDTRTGEQIVEIFQALNRQGVTIIIVTHEPDIAVQARRIVTMRDGRIVADRPTDEYRAELRRAGREILPHLAPQGPAALPAHAARTAAGADATEDSRSMGSRPAPDATTPSLALGVRDSAAGVQAECGMGFQPVTTAEEAPRLARGATAALVCGMVGPGLALAAWLTGVFLRNWLGPRPGWPLPSAAIAIGTAALVALLASVVLGFLAIAWGRGVLRRMYEEPGNWLGARRAKLAMALGGLAVLLPILVMIANRAAG